MQVRLHRVGGGVFVGRRPPPPSPAPCCKIVEKSFHRVPRCFHTHTHIMTHDVDLKMACMLMLICIPYRHMHIGDPFRLYKPCSLPAQAHTRTLAHINNRKHMRAHTHTYKMEVPCTPIGSCENISTGNRKYINLAL